MSPTALLTTPRAALHPPTPAGGDPPPGGRAAVLLVECDEVVREVAARVLGAAGYVVHAAASADEALRLAAERGPIHLLVADLLVPEAGNGELARRLGLRHASVRTLYLSALPAEAVSPPRVRGTPASVLAKPFGASELLGAVHQALAATPAVS